MSAQFSGDDLSHLAAVLAKAFPELRNVRPLSVLGRGFRSLALETAGGTVIRVGLSQDAARDYEREWRVADFLASHLGPLVPRPLWYARPRDALPHGAVAYNKLPGDAPAWGVDPGDAFARDLGAFMARLHALPLDEARAAGVPEVDAYRRLLGARDVFMPVLATTLDSAAFSRVDVWWEAFASDARMRTDRLAVCHHDLWHDNLLKSDSGRLTGVLDLAHVEVTDPAHDFAAPRYFGDEFLDRLVSAYRSAGGNFDAEDAYRAERFYQGREFGGLAWAIEHNDEQEVADSVRKVLNGPIFQRH